MDAKPAKKKNGTPAGVPFSDVSVQPTLSLWR